MAEAASHKLQETVAEIVGLRKLIRWLAAVTIASVLVTALAVYLFFRVHDSDVGNCLAGNQTRAQQLQLWNDLFTLSAQDATGKPTVKTEQLTNEFLSDVKKTYAPVDCSKRYPFW